MKAIIYAIPKLLRYAGGSTICHQSEHWNLLTKVRTVNIGGKTYCTGLQFSRGVWDAHDDLRERWSELCYRMVDPRSGELCGVCLFDDPDQWRRFTPRIGSVYMTPGNGGAGVDVWITGRSEGRKMWHSMRREVGSAWWTKDLGGMYPGTFGPHNQSVVGVPLPGEVICVKSVCYGHFSLERVIRSPDHPDVVMFDRVREFLPLNLHQESEETQERVVRANLQRLNAQFWLEQHLCPLCQGISELRPDEGTALNGDPILFSCMECHTPAEVLAAMQGKGFASCPKCYGLSPTSDLFTCDCCNDVGFLVLSEPTGTNLEALATWKSAQGDRL